MMYESLVGGQICAVNPWALFVQFIFRGPEQQKVALLDDFSFNQTALY